MRFSAALPALLTLVLAAPAPAQDETPSPPAASAEDEAIHDALRDLKDACAAAISAGDVDALLPHLHPNVVVTWPTTEVSRGREGVKAFYEKLLTGPDAPISSYSTQAEVDELTILYGGDTGIAWGTAEDAFTMKGGETLAMTTRWCATVVLHEGQWVVASFSGAVNPFDNPVLATAAKASGLTAGVLALIVGLVLGVLGASLRRSRSA